MLGFAPMGRLLGERKAVQITMGRKKLFGLLCTIAACAVLAGCGKQVKEQWAYTYELNEPVLIFYEDGSAEYKDDRYKSYEVTADHVCLTDKGGKTKEMKYYDSENGVRHLYDTKTYEFMESAIDLDSSTLQGIWTNDNGWSYQFTANGTFLEDGLWAGYYFVDEDGSIRLRYDNDGNFDSISIYYTIDNGKLTVEYPWSLVKMDKK